MSVRVLQLDSNLYNMLHGIEPTADIVMTILSDNDVDSLDHIGRFRDAYVTYLNREKTEPVFVILTRTGGNNRVNYAEHNAALQRHPDYLDDADDEFDATFALFRFQPPVDMRDWLMNYLSINGA